MRLPGAVMSERLEALSRVRFYALDDLWSAHKILNRLAHEGSKNVRRSELVEAMQKYEKALKELEMI